MIRPLPVEGLQANLRKLQERKVPMLISSNLEYGGNGALSLQHLWAVQPSISTEEALLTALFQSP